MDVLSAIDDKTALEAPVSDLLTIGEMARSYGISLRALRFYEDRGLIKPLRQGLTRLYDSRTRSRLSVILKGKQLGFTLTEINRMLAEKKDTEESEVELTLAPEQVLDQIEMLERQRAEIEMALSELKATQARLAAMPGSIIQNVSHTAMAHAG